LIPIEDEHVFFRVDVRSKLTDELIKNGIQFRFETEIESVEKQADDVYRVKFHKDNTPIETNLVMFAIGREPATENLGLDRIGVKTNAKGVVQVDDYSQTNVSNIYAVGIASRQYFHRIIMICCLSMI
jgi:glutathione reductase (NADPH)